MTDPRPDRASASASEAPSHRWRAFAAGVGLASLTGVLTFLSFPRWDLFPLAFVALVPLILLLERAPRARVAFGWAWWAGFVTNAGGFYWIVGMLQEFAYLPLAAALPVHGLLIAQQGVVLGLAGAIAHGLRRRRVSLLGSWVPAVVAAETLVPLIFPWFLGNSQARFIGIIQIAELGGVLLVTAAVVAVNVFWIEAGRWMQRRSRPDGPPGHRPTLAVVPVACALALLFGGVRIAQEDQRAAEAPSLRIGVVQANIGIREKSDPDRMRNNLLIHQNHSAALAEQGAELLIWPETAFQERHYLATLEPAANLAEARLLARMTGVLRRETHWLPPSDAPLVQTWQEDDIARRPFDQRVAPHRGFRVPLLTGVILHETFPPDTRPHLPPFGPHPRTWEVFNSALLLDADGRVLGSADKVRLMPFGEHVPLARWLYRTTGINLLEILPGVSDFSPGTEVGVLPLPIAREGHQETFRIGMLNCYEDILPRFGRMLNPLQPHVLVNLTNDAWFGDTSEPWLHQQLAVFRAIEQRTWLIRSTNTGVSAFIDANGRVIQHTETFVEDTLLLDTPMVPARATLYMRIGDWPGVLAMLWILVVHLRSLVPWRRRRRQRGADFPE